MLLRALALNLAGISVFSGPALAEELPGSQLTKEVCEQCHTDKPKFAMQLEELRRSLGQTHPWDEPEAIRKLRESLPGRSKGMSIPVAPP
jgi:hypothetical protein